jgi:hypothetical protein
VIILHIHVFLSIDALPDTVKSAFHFPSCKVPASS